MGLQTGNIIKSFAVFACLAGCLCGQGVWAQSAGSASSPRFFSAYQDVPVMPGLVEVEDRSFTYDKPEGEITEIVARVDSVTEEQVLQFYEISLPQFGWSRVTEEGHFFRKGEYLDITFEADGDQTYVRIMIRPSR